MGPLGRILWRVGLLLAALAAAAYCGPRVVRALTPDALATVDDLIDRLWWPATGLRLAVYGVLAWGVYPVWVRERIRATTVGRAALPPAGEDPAADAERACQDAGLAPLERAAQRQWAVFGMLLASDLLIAQLPYGLLRG